MAKFRYTAIDGSGKVVKGLVDAASQAAVIERVQGMGHLPLRADAADGGVGSFGDLMSADLFGGKGLSKKDVANFTRELSIMLGAGQDLDHAMRFLVDMAANPRVRDILSEIRDQVRGGASLATALAKQPGGFSRLYIGLVRAGEASGSLAQTLDHLAVLLERQRSLANTVQSALIYPALLVTASIGAIVLLLVFVLPQFTPIFEEAGAKLPGPTQALIDLGAFVRDDGLWLLIALITLAVLVRQLLRRPGPRARFHHALLRIPIIGGLISQAEAARLTRTLGTLLGNGVGLLGALAITREVLGNLSAVAALDKAAASVKEGAGLARPLGLSTVFPKRTVHLLRLGEETGRLGDMALRAAEIHEEQVRSTVQRLVALMVPVITIVMGMLVAGIIGSLLLAMMSINDLAGQ